jgi:membrane protease subunit HflC
MTRPVLILVVLLLLLWGRTAFYAVDQAEYAFVTRFGERMVVHDGADAAGLHIKAPWPIDTVQRIDRRVQSFDLPAVESLTRDPANRTVDKTLAVDAYATWKVPTSEAADLFFRTVRTPEQARKILGPLVNSRLAAVISTLPIDDLIGVADVESGLAAVTGLPAVLPSDVLFRSVDMKVIDDRAERVRRRLLGEEGLSGGIASSVENVRARALGEYGIEIVDIRIRRFSYPEAVRGSIAERIRSERAKKVADYESEGRKKAADITTDADRAARTVEADARAKRTVIEGEANADAARIRASAYAKDREFYLFLESVRAFQSAIADTRDVLLLSTKHPLLAPLAGPPKPNGQK